MLKGRNEKSSDEKKTTVANNNKRNFQTDLLVYISPLLNYIYNMVILRNIYKYKFKLIKLKKK